MKKIIFTCILCSIFTLSHAGEAEKRKNVELLLELTKADQIVETMYAQVDQVMSSMGQQFGIKPSEQKYLDKYIKKITTAMRQEVSWEKMKGGIIDIYLKNYTDKEIQDMIVFYNSETGKSVVNKMPVVMQESMQNSQKRMVDFMPRLQEIAAELQQELMAARKQKTN